MPNSPASAPGRFPPGQTILLDADDTLWENNIYFERAIAGFISYLDHRVHTPEEVRSHLNIVERATIAQHGYGLNSFRRSLIHCFEHLTSSPVTEDQHRRIVSFVESIASQEIELLPDVAETLAELASRHRLLVVTKGDEQEQLRKVERSGLEGYFDQVEVLPEKSEEAYRTLAMQQGFNCESTWMIGNSPKSDINPALAAGLNAVFIPHDFTWVLEHEVIARAPSNRILFEIERFGDLTKHF